MQETHGCETNNGAGILLLCPSTRRILLGLRSSDSSEAHTWCNFGGGMQTGETPLKAALRENLEESEIYPAKVIKCPLYVNVKDDGYKYHTYIGIVNSEITPTINEEHADYNWYRLSELDDIPLHTEFKAEMDKSEILEVVRKYLNNRVSEEN